MKTYLVVWFSSDGDLPSEIISRLTSMGFDPVTGNYDFEYRWDKNPGNDELFRFIDQVQKTLQGTGAFFKVETV
ncbi:MAG: hypothetical protein Q8P02_03530 [Candidatus Micrarchaeota archaeon]|nr:hypothetical protein [Candidatus Micrarchaeota archaeon]